MDKDDTQHLEEYRAYLKALKIRVSTMENLIRPLEAQEQIEGEVPLEFIEPKHKKITDDEVMNLD